MQFYGVSKMESKGFIRQKQLLPKLGFSAPTLWRKIKQGSFPKPVKLGKNITAWRLEDIDDWFHEQS
jgi:predicted DNA-binding transcriptional regulator AlpA